MALSLPSKPDLERIRRNARRLQRGVRDQAPDALELVRRHHPHGPAADPSTFSLSDAQLVLARAYGFRSWPRLRDYLRAAKPLWRDPAALDDAALHEAALDDAAHAGRADPAAAVAALACLTYTDRDEPARWARATEVAAAHPGLALRDVSVAAATGDAEALRAHVVADPASATRDAGPFRWPPLLYVVYSRMPQRAPVEAARILLDAGADADSGYLWQGLPTAFTALTGVFGEGENGPGRQPRHPQSAALATLLLARGADPNDRQALYNRMFNRDDSHLELLLAHGLGHPAGEVWARRTGDPGESIEEMLLRQLHWAADHGFADRLELLARHGLSLESAWAAHQPNRVAERAPSPLPVIHRAATPAAVRAAVAEGADVNARHDGRTALHQAAFMGDAELVTALLAAGADPQVRDDAHGTTALGWAQWARQDAVTELLADAGPHDED